LRSKEETNVQKKFIFIQNIFNSENIYMSLRLIEATNATKKFYFYLKYL